MLAIIRMIVVLSSICGLSGFALSYLKISTAPRIEEQVLTYVQGPAILKVFADIDNSPIAERKTFTLDGAKVTVFPGKKDGKLVAVALEHFGKGSTISSTGVVTALGNAAKVYAALKPEIVKAWQ